MALLTLVAPETTTDQKKKPTDSSKRKNKNEKRHSNPKPKPKPKPEPAKQSSSSSWDQIKGLLTCKQIEGSQVHDPSKNGVVVGHSSSSKLIGSSCGSICSFRDVVHGNTRVVHRADINSPETSSLGHDSAGSSLSRKQAVAASATTRSSARSNGSGAYTSSSHSKGMQFRKLSGCYECHMIVDPSRYPIQPRSTICSCPHCGEVFPKIESLELHQAVRHAVSELGAEDSGRNIVEIIFKSSWLKKENSPMFKIDRILKVHNTQRTIQRFEDCRDAVKSRARKMVNPRCAADGNELLRFHCTSLSCSLGSRGSSSLCSASSCRVCSLIRHGFAGKVPTTASSGRAHASHLDNNTNSRRAMIVCRVIAGRVKGNAAPTAAGASGNDDDQQQQESSGYDSAAGIRDSLEDLVVFNPRAVLPCFVVVYRAVVGAQLGSQ